MSKIIIILALLVSSFTVFAKDTIKEKNKISKGEAVITTLIPLFLFVKAYDNTKDSARKERIKSKKHDSSKNNKRDDT